MEIQGYSNEAERCMITINLQHEVEKLGRLDALSELSESDQFSNILVVQWQLISSIIELLVTVCSCHTFDGTCLT